MDELEQARQRLAERRRQLSATAAPPQYLVPSQQMSSGEWTDPQGLVTPEMGAPAAAPQIDGPLAQFGAGSQEGIARMLGFPVDAVTGALNAVGGYTGLLPQIENPVLGSEQIDSWLAPLRENVAEPTDAFGRYARRVGEEVGGSAAMLPLTGAVQMARGANLMPIAFADVGGSIGAGIGAQTANEMFPDSPTAELIGALAGGVPAGALVARQFSETPLDVLRANDVSSDDLRTQAGRLYEDARMNGVTASQGETGGLLNNLRTIGVDEGVISPSGRVAESYPRIRDVLSMAGDYAQGTMDPAQMQAMRRTLQGAAASTDGAERRIGTQMLREFDAFTAPLAPQFSEANSLYSRAMRSGQLETARELAEARAGQFTGSGLENALRTEYRAIDRDMARGRPSARGFSGDTPEAIRTVARGDALTNAARAVGRFAPTGVVSAGLGGGMPFLIGSQVGGPVLGTIAGLGTMAAGAVGRNVATNRGLNAIETAELLARSATGRMPSAAAENISPVVAALIASRNLDQERD